MFYTFDTVDTTRIANEDLFAFAVNVSRMVFSMPMGEMKPSAVILVPPEPYHFSFIASSIVHHPINASFLFTPQNILLPVTLQEIMRLSPSAEHAPAQVILVGPIGEEVEKMLHMYGFSTYRIGSNDIFETMAQVLYFRLVMIPPEGETGKNNIIVVSADTGEEALPATYYAAHMGTPIIFVNKYGIPPATRWVFENFKDQTYTLFGSQKTISEEVELEIRDIVPNVDRIEGNNAYEISVNFSKRQFTLGKIGWGYNIKGLGNAFSFGTIPSWQKAVAGLLFAHMGKHTPLLLVKPEKIPNVVKEYSEYLKPPKKEPPMPPYMHGFILGSYEDISYENQLEIESIIMSGM